MKYGKCDYSGRINCHVSHRYKKKINSYWHADSYGCYCGGHKSSTECMWNSKYELLVITGLTLVMSLMCAITHMLGVADAVVIGIVALAIGIRKAISVFIGAMMAVCVISGILLILKKLRRKDTIPFIPFILLSYMGVTLCG